MKISTITQRIALDLLGSEATDAQANAMIDILQTSGHVDTDDIDNAEWRILAQRAIAVSADKLRKYAL